MGYYAIIRRVEIMQFTCKFEEIINIMLSEVSQKER